MVGKKELYFEAGADEVWFCRVKGTMEFYANNQPLILQSNSVRCPSFSYRIET